MTKINESSRTPYSYNVKQLTIMVQQLCTQGVGYYGLQLMHYLINDGLACIPAVVLLGLVWWVWHGP